MHEAKKDMRNKMIEIRKKIEMPVKKQKDEKIAQSFTEFLKIKNIKSIILYASFGSEVDTWKIFKYCQENSIKTAFPKVNKEKGSLEFYWVRSIEQLSTGFRSILEPYNCEKALIHDIEAIAVPGVAFDKDCYRIGYGGGFYDRVLTDERPLSIGLAYEEQIVERIPREAQDKKVDLIITDERIISCV